MIRAWAGRALVTAFLLVPFNATLLAAQAASARSVRDIPGYAGADDWSRDAIANLVALGLLDAGSIGSWPLRRGRVIGLFAAASTSSDAGSARATTYLDRYLRDHPVHHARIDFAASADVQWVEVHSLLRAGRSVPSSSGYDYEGPRPVADTSMVRTTLGAWAGLSNTVFAGLDVEVDRDGARIADAAVDAVIGPIGVWAGRRRVRNGPSHGGAIVLAGNVAIDGGAISTPDGFSLPGFLAGAGRVTVDASLARLGRSGEIRRPWFLAQRIAILPSASLAFGLNRAAIFGGDGNAPVSAARVLWMLLGQTDIGSKDSDFENQVVSFDATLRLPGSPVLIWAEYGFDDAGLALVRVPGLIAGARAAVPGTTDFTIGAEAAWFAGRCCGHPSWYVHGALADGWSDRGRLLGHPLGGEGVELAALSSVAVKQARIIGRSRAFVRHRGDENLFAPDRAGRSVGIEASLSAVLWRFTRFEGAGSIEHGAAWTRSVLRAGLTLAR